TENKESPGPKLPADIAGGFDFAPNDMRVAFTIAGSNAPADIWVIGTTTFDIKQLTRSPHPAVDLTKLIRPELVAYTAEDGVQLSGWLYRPRGVDQPYPTVFSFHGGPEGQERREKDRKSTRLNSSHEWISYAVFCLKKKRK